jgi:hypothetical protein
MNYDLLRHEFDKAVSEMDPERGYKLTTAFYGHIGAQVFEAGCEALKDSFALSKSAAALDHRLDAYSMWRTNRHHRVHVVSAPVGSGKTSFSLAFIVTGKRAPPRQCSTDLRHSLA